MLCINHELSLNYTRYIAVVVVFVVVVFVVVFKQLREIRLFNDFFSQTCKPNFHRILD